MTPHFAGDIMITFEQALKAQEKVLSMGMLNTSIGKEHGAITEDGDFVIRVSLLKKKSEYENLPDYIDGVKILYEFEVQFTTF